VTCDPPGTWFAGQAVTVLIPVVADKAGTYENRATVTSTGWQAGPAKAAVLVTAETPGIPFTITKRGPATARIGDVFNFDIWVFFMSRSTNVIITDGE
jgi:hypothetical protein